MADSGGGGPTANGVLLLRERLRGAGLYLQIEGATAARRERDGLIAQIDDYLLPRLKSLEAPLLVVVGGSTGAGKSTLVNSLVGKEVTAAGVLRPTTHAPVLICHPDDEGWFSDDRILPGFARATGRVPSDPHSLHLVTDEGLPAGLALLDAPDIDSIVASNRALADELLGAADLWIFVTTAARYADAVPWDLLKTAEERSTSLAIVLNRVPEEAISEVSSHLTEMLAAEGLKHAPLFTIPEMSLRDGRIKKRQLRELSDWLTELASDAEARAAIVRATLEGALASLRERVARIADHMRLQTKAAAALSEEVQNAYEIARREIDEGLSGGTLLRGEVLARWHEFVGTGDLMKSLETRVGWVRDRVTQALTGRPAAANEVKTAIENSIQTIVVAASDRAAERSVEAWSASPAGSRLLTALSAVGLKRSSSGLRDFADSEIRAWQSDVLKMVSEEGSEKRATGRVLSFGVNSAGAALMVTVFAHTGGLTGGEVAVAGGTAAVSQKLLEALFGDQAVRSLAGKARTELLFRVDRILAGETTRFDSLLRPFSPQEKSAAELMETVDAVTVTL